MSPVISTQVSDELADRIDEYREGEPPDYDESRSSAMERLLREGLDATEGPPQTIEAFIQTGYMVGALLLLLALSGAMTLTGAIFGATMLTLSIAGHVHFYGNPWRDDS